MRWVLASLGAAVAAGCLGDEEVAVPVGDRGAAPAGGSGLLAGAGGVGPMPGAPPGKNPESVGGTPSHGGESGGVVAGAAGLGAAGISNEQDLPLGFVGPPAFTGNPNPLAPQVGIISAELSVPAALTIEVAGGGEEWTLMTPSRATHEQPIVGLLPDTQYSVTLTARTAEQSSTTSALTWRTPPLPAEFPRFVVSVSDTAGMEPGMTFFNVRLSSGEDLNSPFVIVDEVGRVRWFYWDPEFFSPEDGRQLPGGDFLLLSLWCEIREVDLLGRRLRSFHPARAPDSCRRAEGSIPVDVDSFHHEAGRPLGLEGNYLTLSTERRTVEDYPTSHDDPNAPTETAQVSGGVIVEFASDGQVKKYLPLMDLVDPTRVGRGSVRSGSTSRHYGDQVRDWDHANAIIFDPATDSYIVSQRNQDAVLKVSRSTGELVWILGPPANHQKPWSEKLLRPTGFLEWQYHQHAVELTPLGLGLYDNGNDRASAFEEPKEPWGRAVVFAIDEEQLTVEQAWSFGAPSGPDFFFSAALGDADLQPQTGNMLIVNGGPSQIIEVNPSGERVFQMTAEGAGTIYRAERIEDIRHP